MRSITVTLGSWAMLPITWPCPTSTPYTCTRTMQQSKGSTITGAADLLQFNSSNC
jgi:hypothetical protein